jgi:hypothetical protein
MRAQLPFAVDAPATSGAEGLFFDPGKQRLLLQRLLILLLNGLRRPENPIDDQAREAEEQNEQRGGDSNDAVVSSVPDIPPGPKDETEPEGGQEGSEGRGEVEDEGL